MNDYLEELNLNERFATIENFEKYIITESGKIYKRINRNEGHKYRPNHWREIKVLKKKNKSGKIFLSVELNNESQKFYSIYIEKLLKTYFPDKFNEDDELIEFIKHIKMIYPDEAIIKTKFRDIYITNYGRVFKIYKKIDLIYCKELKASLNDHGYMDLCVRINKIKKHLLIHRLVAEGFVENPNPLEFNCVDHIDNNKINNYYKNLQWCTNEFNISKFFKNPVNFNGKTKKSRKILILDLNNGNKYYYNSIADCYSKTGISKYRIAKYLNDGKIMPSKNYKFIEIN